MKTLNKISQILFLSSIISLFLVAPVLHAATNSYVNNCGTAQVKPNSLTQFCADAGAGLTGIKWSSWTSKSAMGTALYSENDCTPNCAAGKIFSTKVSVILSQPTTTHGHLYLMKVTFKPLVGAKFNLPKGSTKPNGGTSWIADFWRN